MNTKGGIYTTLAAVLMLSVMGASIAQVMAMQDDVGVKMVGSEVRDVRFAWINARYLADKAASKSIYMQVDAGTCTLPADAIIDAAVVLEALGAINNIEMCTITPPIRTMLPAPMYEYVMFLTCDSADGSVSFTDTVRAYKIVSTRLFDHDGDPGTASVCEIKIEDTLAGSGVYDICTGSWCPP